MFSGGNGFSLGYLLIKNMVDWENPNLCDLCMHLLCGSVDRKNYTSFYTSEYKNNHVTKINQSGSCISRNPQLNFAFYFVNEV
jgi:hypothetical protein